MIEPEQLYNVNFYQKEKFYGSYKGMHYRIEKYEQPAEEETSDNSAEKDTSSDSEHPQPGKMVFRVFIWPGPYNFASTADEKKEAFFFDFSNEALKEICSFLNRKWIEQYQN